MNSKEAIKTVAKDRDLSKRDVYQIYHVDKNKLLIIEKLILLFRYNLEVRLRFAQRLLCLR